MVKQNTFSDTLYNLSQNNLMRYKEQTKQIKIKEHLETVVSLRLDFKSITKNKRNLDTSCNMQVPHNLT